MFNLLKKYRKIVLIISLTVLSCFTYYFAFILIDQKFSIYNFAISKQENPQYFNNKYYELGLNRGGYSNQKYSFLSEIILEKNEIIEIEHGVQVSKNDIKKIPELKGYNYIFSGIEIENGKNMDKISIRNYYKNKELESFGTYVFQYEKDEEGLTLYNKPKVKNISEHPDQIKEKGHFLYVKIYKFPTNVQHFKWIKNKQSWFKNEITQKIDINYKDANGKSRSEEFTFQLHWIRWMIFLDRFFFSQ
ncbi:hypothetical protein [Bacillus sp. EAC]|uniref:hypothetical protein n=1 Tax=Bacillus sp. EAC TaxID=1978338 RepID=UPI000B43D5E1|nr:hypothetical protein [Bacillus sp. EAC]